MKHALDLMRQRQKNSVMFITDEKEKEGSALVDQGRVYQAARQHAQAGAVH